MSSTKDSSTTSPEERRVKTRRQKLRTIWKSKEWKDAVRGFTNGRSCEWCGATEKLTAHHPYYANEGDIYLDLYLSGCLVLCNRCHFSIHHNLTICPNCREHYTRTGATVCFGCYLRANPEVAERITIAKEKKKRLQKELRKKFTQKEKPKRDSRSN
jgi:predicted Fe-S protein YdhL (DUF1289 family)